MGHLTANNGSFPQLPTTKVSSVGYSFEPKGLLIAPKTLANFLDRIAQLYEQGADVRRIGQYVRNYCPAGGATAGSPVGGAIPGGPGGGAIPGAGAVA